MLPDALKHAQLARIDRLPDECKVVGQTLEGHPVISYPTGKMQVIDHTGRLRAASPTVVRQITKRQVDRMTVDPVG